MILGTLGLVFKFRKLGVNGSGWQKGSQPTQSYAEGLLGSPGPLASTVAVDNYRTKGRLSSKSNPICQRSVETTHLKCQAATSLDSRCHRSFRSMKKESVDPQLDPEITGDRFLFNLNMRCQSTKMQRVPGIHLRFYVPCNITPSTKTARMKLPMARYPPAPTPTHLGPS